MFAFLQKRRSLVPFRILVGFIAYAFVFTAILPPAALQAASAAQATVLGLPMPGAMVVQSRGYVPALLKGVKIDPLNPLKFDFIIDLGEDQLGRKDLEAEANKLIKYFLATLTVPEKDLWVNLSPYEKERIIPDGLSVTEMGRDLLGQDYMLKQLTASLIYPENDLGHEFWQRVYKRAQEEFGTTNIPVSTFNKIWIVPEDALVVEENGSAFVVDSHLKVMLEQDYLALEQNLDSIQDSARGASIAEDYAQTLNKASADVVREVLIPEIEKEVNEGKNFAPLRQIYNSMILATWYKQNLRDGLLGQVYMDQNKVKGIDIADRETKQKIYNQYLEAFKTGVYSYIKEDYDEATHKMIPRKYFSGGFAGQDIERAISTVRLGRDNLPSSSPLARRIAAIGQGTGSIVSTAVVLAETNQVVENPVVSSAVINGIEEAARDAGLTSSEKGYMKSLALEYNRLNDPTRPTKPIKYGENFKPSAIIPREQRAAILGLRTMSDIIPKLSEYRELAKEEVILLEDLLAAGAGESVDVARKLFLSRTFGPDRQPAAKSQDFFFEEVRVPGKDAEGNAVDVPVMISVHEQKYLHVIMQASEYRHQSIRTWVSLDSLGPVDAFLDQVFLLDRVDETIPKEKKRTYRQLFQEGPNLSLRESEVLRNIPVFHMDEHVMTAKVLKNGSHGQVGYRDIHELAERSTPPGSEYNGGTVIKVTANADGPNNGILPEIAGYMVRNNIPIFMLYVEKTPLDVKGGQLGARKIDPDTGQITDWEDPKGILVPAGVEKAQPEAEDADRLRKQVEGPSKLRLWNEMGLTEGEPGGQLFNTNTKVENETVLWDILRMMKSKLTDEEFSALAKPDLIAKPPKVANEGTLDEFNYIAFEGAMSTAMFNLNQFFMTSQLSGIKEVRDYAMQKYGIDRLVYILEVPRGLFTPEKASRDHWLYTTDHYSLNPQTFMLDDQNPGHIPSFGAMDPFYNEYANLQDALGKKAQAKNLDKLSIAGRVLLSDPDVDNGFGPAFSGVVQIESGYRSNQPFNLAKYWKANQLPLTEDGRLILSNVRVKISSQGIVTVKDVNTWRILHTKDHSLLQVQEGIDGILAGKPEGTMVDFDDLLAVTKMSVSDLKITLYRLGYEESVDRRGSYRFDISHRDIHASSSPITEEQAAELVGSELARMGLNNLGEDVSGAITAWMTARLREFAVQVQEDFFEFDTWESQQRPGLEEQFAAMLKDSRAENLMNGTQIATLMGSVFANGLGLIYSQEESSANFPATLQERDAIAEQIEALRDELVEIQDEISAARAAVSANPEIQARDLEEVVFYDLIQDLDNADAYNNFVLNHGLAGIYTPGFFELVQSEKSLNQKIIGLEARLAASSPVSGPESFEDMTLRVVKSFVATSLREAIRDRLEGSPEAISDAAEELSDYAVGAETVRAREQDNQANRRGLVERLRQVLPGIEADGAERLAGEFETAYARWGADARKIYYGSSPITRDAIQSIVRDLVGQNVKQGPDALKTNLAYRAGLIDRITAYFANRWVDGAVVSREQVIGSLLDFLKDYEESPLRSSEAVSSLLTKAEAGIRDRVNQARVATIRNIIEEYAGKNNLNVLDVIEYIETGGRNIRQITTLLNEGMPYEINSDAAKNILKDVERSGRSLKAFSSPVGSDSPESNQAFLPAELERLLDIKSRYIREEVEPSGMRGIRRLINFDGQLVLSLLLQGEKTKVTVRVQEGRNRTFDLLLPGNHLEDSPGDLLTAVILPSLLQSGLDRIRMGNAVVTQKGDNVVASIDGKPAKVLFFNTELKKLALATLQGKLEGRQEYDPEQEILQYVLPNGAVVTVGSEFVGNKLNLTLAAPKGARLGTTEVALAARYGSFEQLPTYIDAGTYSEFGREMASSPIPNLVGDLQGLEPADMTITQTDGLVVTVKRQADGTYDIEAINEDTEWGLVGEAKGVGVTQLSAWSSLQEMKDILEEGLSFLKERQFLAIDLDLVRTVSMNFQAMGTLALNRTEGVLEVVYKHGETAYQQRVADATFKDELALILELAREASEEARVEFSETNQLDEASSPLGGINLDPALLDLQIKRDRNGVPLPLPQQPIQDMNIQGFLPIIINITPLPGLPLTLSSLEPSGEAGGEKATTAGRTTPRTQVRENLDPADRRLPYYWDDADQLSMLN